MSTSLPNTINTLSLPPIDCKLLQAGPGSIHHAHTEHEHIALNELEEGVALYQQLLQKL